MPLQPNKLTQSLTESVTLAITATALRMRNQGLDVVSLGAGEPDFGTMDEVSEAGIAAIRAGQTRYTAAAGNPSLRAAGAAWLNREFGYEYNATEVMATAGAKPALHVALSSILEPGDCVLLPAPYWVSYPSLVRISGGIPIDMPPVPDQGFVHTGDQLRAAAREHRAKGVMFNFPNNPSGAMPTREQMRDLVTAAIGENLWIISDEIYATMLYDGAEFVSPAEFARERTLLVNGGSKCHSLTGWRIGFLAGPAAVITAAVKIQSQAIGNPSSISQAAGQAACQLDLRPEMQRRLQAFDERRRFLLDQLSRIAGIAAAPPRGAFYVLADARELCRRLGVDDIELAQLLLERAHVALVPGSAFAIPGFLRLSYAASMEELKEATSRLARFVEQIG